MQYDPYWPFYTLDTVSGSMLRGFKPALRRIGFPAPLLSLAEIRLHLKLDPLPVDMATGALLPDDQVQPNPDDSLVKGLVLAVQGELDGWGSWVQRGVMLQTWELTFSAFPPAFRIPLPPTRAVSKVEYRQLDGTYTDAPAVWTVRQSAAEPHALFQLLPGQTWLDLPAYENGYDDAVKITFLAGYDAGDPELELIKTYARLKVGTMYENRESAVVGTSATILPGWEHMLENVRVNHPEFLRS